MKIFGAKYYFLLDWTFCISLISSGFLVLKNLYPYCSGIPLREATMPVQISMTQVSILVVLEYLCEKKEQ